MRFLAVFLFMSLGVMALTMPASEAPSAFGKHDPS